MNVKCKSLIILLTLILSLLIILNVSPVNSEKGDIDSNELNEQIIKGKELKKPKVSGFWNVDFIHIKNDNWSTTILPWIQNRTGTYQDPHIIENITINGLNKKSCIFIENCDQHFIIRNCTLYNSTRGIKVSNVQSGYIVNNTCFNHSIGIYLNESKYIDVSENIITNNTISGLDVLGCNYSRFLGNYIYNNSRGAWLNGYNISFYENKIIKSSGTGIYCFCRESKIHNNYFSQHLGGMEISSSNCEFFNNTFFLNGYGLFSIWGSLNNYNNISYNTFNNNSLGISLTALSYTTISNNLIINNSDGGIYLYATWLMGYNENNTIIGNRILNNGGPGISLSGIYDIMGTPEVKYINITENTIKNNEHGIILKNSDYNTIKQNLIKNNTLFGINMSNIDVGADNNLIYYNAFIENGQYHAQDSGNNNEWDNGLIGNYWDNYTDIGGIDSNNDGVGEMPYPISGTGIDDDDYPIFNIPYHQGEKVHIDDTGVNALNWAQTSLIKWWCDGKGTKSIPYVIRDLTIDGGGSGNCILIENSSVNSRIENCTIFNSGSSDAGIKLVNVNNSLIIRNNCSDNYYGIYLSKCYNNLVHNNTIFNKTEGPSNRFGIYLEYSNENNITSNVIYDVVGNSFGNGIYLLYSNYSFILDNIVFNHRVGISIAVTGIYNYFSENIIYNNSVGLIISGEDNTVYNNTVKFNKAEGGIYIRGNNNKIVMNTVHNNSKGIWVTEGYNHTVIYNTVSNNIWGIALMPDIPDFPLSKIYENYVINNTLTFNEYGIEIYRANLTVITMNYVKNNSKIGLLITKSDFSILNLVYNNSFTGNKIHAIDNGAMNYWNSSIIGNYWDNYTGLDEVAPFGIGDTPYNISGSAGSTDYLPLIKYGLAPVTPEPTPPPSNGDDDDDDDGGKEDFDIFEFLTSPTGIAIIIGSVAIVAIITILKIKGSSKSRLKEIERIESLRSE